MSWRPTTISQISARTAVGEDFSGLTREFVDEVFKMSPAQVAQAVAQEPQGPWVSHLHKPFLAAMAEHYARRVGAQAPAWAWKSDCFLDKPHFGSSLQSLKAYLLMSSPPSFRRRMIFVERDPIPRPFRSTIFTETPKPKIVGSLKIKA